MYPWTEHALQCFAHLRVIIQNGDGGHVLDHHGDSTTPRRFTQLHFSLTPRQWKQNADGCFR